MLQIHANMFKIKRNLFIITHWETPHYSPLAPGPIGPIVLACLCGSFINKMSKVYPGLHFDKFPTPNSILLCMSWTGLK